MTTTLRVALLIAMLGLWVIGILFILHARELQATVRTLMANFGPHAPVKPHEQWTTAKEDCRQDRKMDGEELAPPTAVCVSHPNTSEFCPAFTPISHGYGYPVDGEDECEGKT